MQQLPTPNRIEHKYYLAIIRGRDPIELTPEQADKISMAMLSGTTGKVFRLPEIDLTIRVSDFRRIEPDLLREERERQMQIEQQAKQLQLIQDRRKLQKCRGQYSIQKRINDAIKERYAPNWHKPIQDTKIRDNIRQALLNAYPDQPWCDYKTSTCSCEAVTPATV